MEKMMTHYKLIKLNVLFLIAFLFNPVSTALAKEATSPAQMIINFYRTPTVAVALDKTYLIYEIYATSQMNMPTKLTSLEVKNGNKVIFTDKKNKISFKPGETHIIYMSIPFPKLSDVPNQLQHQLIFTGEVNKEIIHFPLNIPSITIDKKPHINIGAPLRGKNWLAGTGLSNTSAHRRAALIIEGHPYFPELYAIDFVQMGSNGRTFKENMRENKNYYAYNQDVLAVANAKVVQVQDGIPENIPHSGKFAVEPGEKTLPGNYIILDLGNNKFAGYGHLIPGSLKVKVGDRVKRGQVIAKLGNSGQSGEPHLHFQMMDRGKFIAANPIPYGFDHFNVIPSKMTNVEGDTYFKMKFLSGPLKEYRNQLPEENTLISFD